MRSFSYPVTLGPDITGRRFTVTFRDLPEAITQGTNRKDALAQAADCLDEAIANRLVLRLDIPAPSRSRKGQPVVPVPPLMAAKAALYLAIREAGMSNVQLARLIGCNEKEIRRMLDPRHATKLPRLQEAIEALGKRLVLAVEEAA